MTNIKELAKRALELSEKATKGPWKLHFDADNEADAIILDTKENTACNSEDDVYDTVCTLPVEKYGYGCAWASEPNGKLIVESRTLLPQIAAAYLELAERAERLEAWAKATVDDCNLDPNNASPAIISIDRARRNLMLHVLSMLQDKPKGGE